MTRDQKLLLMGKSRTISEISDRIQENTDAGMDQTAAEAKAARDTILDEPNRLQFQDVEPEIA